MNVKNDSRYGSDLLVMHMCTDKSAHCCTKQQTMSVLQEVLLVSESLLPVLPESIVFLYVLDFV